MADLISREPAGSRPKAINRKDRQKEENRAQRAADVWREARVMTKRSFFAAVCLLFLLGALACGRDRHSRGRISQHHAPAGDGGQEQRLVRESHGAPGQD